jgi:homoserine dehydrogenase
MSVDIVTSGAPVTVGVGLLGCGVVGSAVARILIEEAPVLTARTGMDFEVKAIAVRELERPRKWQPPPELLTTDVAKVVANPEVDVVVELMGGVSPAGELIERSLAAGKDVVTANKELLAWQATHLFRRAAETRTRVYFEAAVAGGVPVLRALQLSLAAEPIGRIVGIVNGTTNYILSSMYRDGAAYADVLKAAQSKGYAEADPSADVEGWDAAAKAAVLARVAFGATIAPDHVDRKGIVGLPTVAFAVARELGCTIKLLALVDVQPATGALVARVHPALVPLGHPLSAVNGAYNAIYIEGLWLGDAMLYGMGAGPEPTASAVVGDLVSAARGIPTPLPHLEHRVIGTLDELSARFCVVATGSDGPGVLSTVDQVFAAQDVALATIAQSRYADDPKIVLTTRDAPEPRLRAALRDLEDLDVIDAVDSCIRFLDPGDDDAASAEIGATR